MPPSWFRSAAAAGSPLVSRMRIRCWVVSQTVSRLSVAGFQSSGSSARLRELDLTGTGLHDTGFDQAAHSRVLGFAQRLGHAERAFLYAELLEPR